MIGEGSSPPRESVWQLVRAAWTPAFAGVTASGKGRLYSGCHSRALFGLSFPRRRESTNCHTGSRGPDEPGEVLRHQNVSEDSELPFLAQLGECRLPAILEALRVNLASAVPPRGMLGDM